MKSPHQNWGTMAKQCGEEPGMPYSSISVLLWQAGGACAVFSLEFEQDSWNARIWQQLARVQNEKLEVKDHRGIGWLACVGTASHGSGLDFQYWCQSLMRIQQPLIWNKWSWYIWMRSRENAKTVFDSFHSSQCWHKILLCPVQCSTSFKTSCAVAVVHCICHWRLKR